MILLKSRIVILIFIILAQLYKKISEYSPKSSEGFRKLYQQNEIFPIAEGENISNVLESRASASPPLSEDVLYASEFMPDYALIEGTGTGTGTGTGSGSGRGTFVGVPASQKAQLKANLEKTDEETKTLGKHRDIMNNSQDMSKLEKQIKELMTLGNQATEITQNGGN